MRQYAAVWLGLTVAFCAAVAGGTQEPPAPLGVGDPAPPLSIAEWIKGAPVDLARDAKKKMHVVEFWAVWCAPCKVSVPLLTRLQEKYKNDVVIVGVTEPDAGANSPTAIRRFVKEQGKDIEYTVAIDTGKTTQSYLAASGAVGIPHAFVVNRQGRIVWQGSPLDPSLDVVLARLIGGTYDLAAAKVEEEVNRRMEQIDFWVQLQQWQRVYDGLVDILKLDPAHEFAIVALQQIAIEELRNPEAFRTWARAHIDAHRGHRRAMQALANALWSTRDLRGRMPDLAFEAAQAAYKAGGERDVLATTVYARALYEIGALDRAIAMQQDAVALAAEDELKEEIKSVLEYYRLCKKLQETIR